MNVIITKSTGNTKYSVTKTLHKLKYKPKKGSVFIKPNIVGGYKSHYVTSPEVVSGIIDYLKEIGIRKIYVGDGPVARNVDESYKKSGFYRMCKNQKVHLLNLFEVSRIAFKVGSLQINLPKIINEAEYINVSKMKTHVLTGVSLCIKNQKGLLDQTDRKLFHENLHLRIAQLYETLKPDLSMIDAIGCIDGDGPGPMGHAIDGGNLLVAGFNTLEVDYVGTLLMNLRPQEIKHLALILDSKEVSLDKNTKKQIKDYVVNFRKPGKFRSYFNARYWWSDETCSGCSTYLSQLKKDIMFNPKFYAFFVYYGIVKRLDILTGKAKIPPHHGKVLCIGDCTKEMANKNRFFHIPGCPPKETRIHKL